MADGSSPFSKSFSSLLDFSRWVAAIAVLINHLRNPIVLGYEMIPPEDINIFITIWYLVSGLGFEAVIVFFVLSGFLVGGISWERADKGRLVMTHYAADRFSRIFTVFVPALFLTVILDSIGHHFFGWTGLWDVSSAQMAARYSVPFTDNLSVAEFLGNLLMLQPFYVRYLGSNVPLWTLSFEWWFYVGFGALIATRYFSWRVIGPLVIFLLCVALGLRFVFFFGLWLIGAFAFRVSCKSLGRPILSVFVFFLFLTASRFNSTPTYPGNAIDCLIIIGIAISFAWVVISYREKEFRILDLSAKLNKGMADFSFSLYAFHFPIMLFLVAAISSLFGLNEIRDGLSPASPVAVALYMGVLMATLLISWLFWYLTERHTGFLRVKLRSVMMKK